jgi:SWI/SNF-related matrix-associated actin-dependent regulator of chromatin subfamily A member 5
MNIIILTGTEEEHVEIIANQLILQDFEVCITSCEICLVEKVAFKMFSFEYIAIDEAYPIKNVDSLLPQIVRTFISCG